uniref:Uncharacterized protein n=1 Tax=Arundo donax TaxID=35708 RepID=A0A0A9FTM8_ARUDO
MFAITSCVALNYFCSLAALVVHASLSLKYSDNT